MLVFCECILISLKSRVSLDTHILNCLVEFNFTHIQTYIYLGLCFFEGIQFEFKFIFYLLGCLVRLCATTNTTLITFINAFPSLGYFLISKIEQINSGRERSTHNTPKFNRFLYFNESSHSLLFYSIFLHTHTQPKLEKQDLKHSTSTHTHISGLPIWGT